MASANAKQDTYVKTSTYVYGNVTVHVHRPILTEYERHKREEACKEALARFGRYLVDAGLEDLL